MRVWFITGASRGFGREWTIAALERGDRVAATARNTDSLDDLVEKYGDALLPLRLDVTDRAADFAAVKQAHERFGRLDVVVNNAGGSPPAEAATVSPRFVEKIVALNLLGPFYVAQRANAVMQGQDTGGVIVNIGSLSGQRGSPGTAAYGAAKAGLANLTRSLAMEWAPKVRVNTVTVGYLETEQADLHYGSEASQAAIARTIPMGRLVSPDDVAQVCLFLASPQAAFVTGADISVDGGGEMPPFLRLNDSDTSGG